MTAATDRGMLGAGSRGFFSQRRLTNVPSANGLRRLGLRLLAACSECKFCNIGAEANIPHGDCSPEIVQLPVEEKHPHHKRTGEHSISVAQIGDVTLHQKQEVTCASSPTSCNQPSIVLDTPVSKQFVSGTSSSGSLYSANQREQQAELSGTCACGADMSQAAEQVKEQTLPYDSKLPTVDPDAQLDVPGPVSKGPGEAPMECEFAEEQPVCLDLPSNLAADMPAPDATQECVGRTCSQQADCIGVAKCRSRSLDACRGMRSQTQGSSICSRSMTNACGDMLASDQVASEDVWVQLREALPPTPETVAGTPVESEQQASVADVPTESAELVAAGEAGVVVQAVLKIALAASAVHHMQAAAEATETQELEATAGGAAAPAPDMESVAKSLAPNSVADVFPNLAEKAGDACVKSGAKPPILTESVELQVADAQLTEDFCTEADFSRATSSTADSPLSLFSEQHELGDSPLSLLSEQHELGDFAKYVTDHKDPFDPASANLKMQMQEFLSPPTATFDDQLPVQVSQPAACFDVAQQAETGCGPEPEPLKPSLLTRRRTSISSRAQAYAAACQSKTENIPPQRRPAKMKPVSLDIRLDKPAKMKPVPLDIPPDKPAQPFRTLSRVTEQRVLKTGLGCLGKKMLVGHDVEHMELPRTTSGKTKVMQGSSLLRRLLKEEVELKSCMEGDVAAAQADLKHLRAEQLLSIRLPTLDFATESQSHSARNSFLDTTDKHLFYKLAKRCLTECSPVPDMFAALHRLGIRISITLGVLDHLSKGWGTQPANAEDLLSLPPCWVIKLDSEDWPQQCKAAIFHSEELWVRSLPGEAPDFAAATTGGRLAVVRDRTTGMGKDRMLHWEIVVMESCSTEDILYEMERDPTGTKKSTLTAELSATLLHRAARNSV